MAPRGACRLVQRARSLKPFVSTRARATLRWLPSTMSRMPPTGSRSISPECCDDRRRILAWFVAIAAFVAPLDAQETRVFDGAPPASWVAPAGVPGDSFTVFHARRTFDLPAIPGRFLVHVSADNRYRLYVNGVQVSSGPQRSDVTHWRYETLDLAPNLRAGRNVIAALVWNWGAAQPVAQHSHRTGFLLQGNGPTEAALVNTGTGWKLLRNAAYAPIVITTATMGDYYAAAPGDSIDGSRYPWGWERPDYADDACERCRNRRTRAAASDGARRLWRSVGVAARGTVDTADGGERAAPRARSARYRRDDRRRVSPKKPVIWSSPHGRKSRCCSISLTRRMPIRCSRRAEGPAAWCASRTPRR